MRLLGRYLAFIAFWVGQAASAAAADCSQVHGVAMTPETETAGLTAYVVTDPSSIPIGRPFRATVSICSPSDTVVDRFEIDATMPRHRHGMNYTPKVTSGDDRTYTATGLFFHMPGLWRIAVTVRSKAKSVRFIHDVVVE